MKKGFIVLLSFVAILMGFSSCAPSDKPAVTGRPYELFVVTPRPVFKGAVGDTLKAIFGQEVMWLNQPEPLFDLFNTPPAGLDNITRNHRNLFIIDINAKYTDSKLISERDKFSSGQLVMTLTSPNADSAAAYIWKQRGNLLDLYHTIERERFTARAQKYGVDALQKTILDKFGFEMAIPRGFRLRVDADNFLWIDNAIPVGSQGIVIYTFDVNDSADSTLFIEGRNSAVARIPGPVDGSFMSTEDLITPETREVLINGRIWYETRGFWNVKGDYMGGPFANFVTIHDGKLLGIDFYLQSPKVDKRNFMRQLEALPYTVKFPTKELGEE